MIKFSLQQIQQNSPYEIVLSEGGDFLFVTDSDITYSISFTEEMFLGECQTYQFILRKIEETHSAHDEKVVKTVLAIINEFFRLNQNVLLYLCDTHDHREEARNRLFINWFQKHAEPNRFTICTAQTNIEGQGFYAAIIIENTNPKLDAIKEDFSFTAEILTNEK